MELSKIYNYRFWVQLTDEKELAPALEKLLREAGYGIVNFVEHQFEPQGYTCTWLLSESHCALHTFPEEGRSYIELSGCSRAKNEHFVASIQHLWKKYISRENQDVT
jgi:S-adenosylmethionine decarboxylase